MITSIKEKISAAMHIDYTKDSLFLKNKNTLMQIVGILGMALPFLLLLFLWIDTGYDKPLESISHYYLTRIGSVFTIILSMLALFLMLYIGYDKKDFRISFIAGLFIFGVLLFPTGNIIAYCEQSLDKVNCINLHISKFRTTLHFICAGIFLSLLAYMSYFKFTKSNRLKADQKKPKKRRNIIYRTCAIIMITAILVIFIGGFLNQIPTAIYDCNHLTFWMETLAVEAFGFSWLVKGELFFAD
jgi:phosphotransferase system  glucose/maltose/N-acetylglucosamine-specific IIC component